MCGCEMTAGATRVSFKIGTSSKEAQKALEKLSGQEKDPQDQDEEKE